MGSVSLTSAPASDKAQAGIPVRSSYERRKALVARIAKADQAVMVAQQDQDADAGRALSATGETQENACGTLLMIDAGIIEAKRKVVSKLEAALPAFDVEAAPADIDWAVQNRERVARMIRDIPKGAGRAAAIVKSLHALKIATEAEAASAK